MARFDRLVRVKNIHNCARCGGSHEGLIFVKISGPIECSGYDYTHWALCPVTHDPIIMAIDEADEDNLEEVE